MGLAYFDDKLVIWIPT